MKKSLLLFVLAQCMNLAQAQSTSAGVNLPFSVLPNGQDRVRSSDGVECSRATGPREKWIEIGTFAYGGNQGATSALSTYGGVSTVQSAPATSNTTTGVYARLTINLDKSKPELDCDSLYQLEITRLRAELDEAKMRSKVSIAR